MIGKIIRRSTDSRSSFRRVVSYVSDRAMTDGRAESLGHAAEYITHAGKARHVHLRHLVSIETAASEMQATARQAPRAGNPVMHIVLSWPEGELPSPKQAWEAGAHVLDSLGLADHQAVLAIHQDTHHRHLHLVCCRVHPVSRRPHYPAWAHRELSRACREIELRQGWTHEPGLYEAVKANGHTVIAPRRKQSGAPSPPETPAISDAARDMEAWSDTASFQRYVSRIGPTVRAALPRQTSWDVLHQALADHGLRWLPYGKAGAVIVDSDNPEQYHCAASRMGSWARRSRLEHRLGPYEAPSEQCQPPEPRRRYRRARKPRDPGKRIARSAARDALRQRYRDYVAGVRAHNARVNEQKRRAWREQRHREHQRWQQFLRQSRERRTELLRGAHTTGARRTARSVAAWERARRKEELDAQRKAERRALRLVYSGHTRVVLPWRRWVYTQYIGGDAEAAHAWRGLVYRGEVDDEFETTQQAPSRCLGALVAAAPPQETGDNIAASMARPQANLWPNTLSNGMVLYCRADDKAAFTDLGRRILVHDQAPDAIEAAVLLAGEKFGGAISVHGSEKFKQRACEMAHKHGIKVSNAPEDNRGCGYKKRQPRQGASRRNDRQELDAFKFINLVSFACDRYGFEIDKRESTSKSTKLRRGDEVLIVRQDEDGRYGYFAATRDADDAGDIIRLVQREDSLNLGQVRQLLREFSPGGSSGNPSAGRRPRDTRRGDAYVKTIRKRWAGYWAIKSEMLDWSYARTRGLTPDSLQRHADQVRIDSYGNMLFAHRDAQGNLRGYEIKGRAFSGFSKGGQKRLFAVGATHPLRIAILESGLDALSMMQYEQRDDTLYVSTGGAPGRRTLEQLQILAERHPTADIAIAVDRDQAGDHYDAQLREALPQERTVDARPASTGIDWNDMLRGPSSPGTASPKGHYTVSAKESTSIFARHDPRH